MHEIPFFIATLTVAECPYYRVYPELPLPALCAQPIEMNPAYCEWMYDSFSW